MTSTFNDLMKFQKSQIVCLDEQSDVPVTLPSEVGSALNKALETFNRAPDNYELADFLPYEKELAA